MKLNLAILGVLLSGCIGKVNQDSQLTDDFVRVNNPRYVTSIDSPRSTEIQICSFNIKFLGFYQDKRVEDLTDFLTNCDIAVIQELVSTPFDTELENRSGNLLEADENALEFFQRMEQKGFKFVLSPEDTGKNNNRVNNTESEWFVSFYRPEKVEPIDELTGYLSETLVSHPVYDRVPFATGFKSKTVRGNSIDFVLISVHMVAGGEEATRRADELAEIKKWIVDQHRQNPERDYIVLGDMNIEDRWELRGFMRAGPRDLSLTSMNWRARGTNLWKHKPYDQVLVTTDTAAELDPQLYIVDITNTFNLRRDFEDNNKFAQAYSDHLPIVFKLKIISDDD